jgi:hypothetical protein
VKPPYVANDDLIDRTRAVWQRRLGRDLSREDARQIAENVTGFFAILGEWSRAEMPVPANDTAVRCTSDIVTISPRRSQKRHRGTGRCRCRSRLQRRSRRRSRCRG